MKAAIYSRISTDRQNERSLITDQQRVCREFAEREGWSIVDTFSDDGISGAALGNRPGAKALLEAAMAKRVDVVLVADLTRLSRSSGDLNKMIDRMVARGIRIVGVQDGYDSERRGHKLQAGVSGIIGEAFRELISDKTYTALQSRAKAHQAAGGACFGYRTQVIDPSNEDSPKLIVIEKSEAKLVREIFKRVARGESARAIASEMNRRGIDSPGARWKRKVRRRRGWLASVIRAIVQNERYTGRITWGRSRWTKDPDSGKRIRKPQSKWLSYQDESLRIIDDEVWSTVQARIKRRDATNRGRPSRYLLTGILSCGNCGAGFIMSGRSYVCSSFANGGAHLCDSNVRISRDVVETLLLARIKKQLVSKSVVAHVQAQMEKALDGLDGAQSAAKLEAELASLNDKIDKLVTGIESMGIDGDDLAERLHQRKREKRDLEARLAAMPNRESLADRRSLIPSLMRNWRSMVERLGTLPSNPHATPQAIEAARASVRALIGKIVIRRSFGVPWVHPFASIPTLWYSDLPAQDRPYDVPPGTVLYARAYGASGRAPGHVPTHGGVRDDVHVNRIAGACFALFRRYHSACD